MSAHSQNQGGSRLLNVLLFTNQTCRAGAEEHMLTLLRGLDRKRFRLYLACPPELAELIGPDVPADVSVIPLFLERPTHIGAAWHLARAFRRHRIDVLHAHLFRSTLISAPIAWLCRVPLVIETTHVREYWRRGLKASYFVDRVVARFVDRFVAVSHQNARYLVREKGIPTEKVVVIHNGVDLSRFNPREDANCLKQALGLGQDDPILVIGARLEPQKGHSVMLEAMPAIVRRFPHVRLVCVGDGSLRATLEGRTRELGLEPNVTFVGYQINMPDWLALADLVVLPSLYEGLPLIAIEALAAGKPVVATEVDGTPEVVVNEKTGLTVPPGDSDALQNAIVRLLDDPNLRRKCGGAGRVWVEEHFDQRAQIRSTEALYEINSKACQKESIPAKAVMAP